MGQDETLNFNSNAENWNSLEELAICYNKINLTAAHSLRIHVAVDVTPDDGEVFMWNIRELEFVFGRAHEEYHPLFLPRLGNISYSWIGTPSPIKHLHCYMREGHQVHRNKDRFFVDSKIKQQLAKLYALLRSKSKKAFLETVADKLLLTGDVLKWVDSFVENIRLRPSARCEVVYEMDKVGEVTALPLRDHMDIAFDCAVDWIKLHDVPSSNYFVTLSSSSLQSWITAVLGPCQRSLAAITSGLSRDLEPFRQAGKRMQNLNLQNPESQLKPSDFLSAQISEIVIGYFFTGRLPRNTPQYMARHLGFSDLGEHAIAFERGSLKNVLFFSDRITCSINTVSFSIGLANSIATGDDMAEFTHELNTWANHFASKKRRPTEELQKDLKDLARSFCTYLQDVAFNGNPAPENFCTSESLDLLALKQLVEDTTYTRLVMSTAEFLSMLGHGKGISPPCLPTMYQCMTNITRAKERILGITFAQSVAQEMNRQVHSQDTPIYLQLSERTVYVILPTDMDEAPNLEMRDEVRSQFTRLYTEAFKWAMSRDDVGRSGISCKSLFQSSILCFLESDLPVMAFMQLINKLMDDYDIADVMRKTLTPKQRRNPAFSEWLLTCFTAF